jgi:hypothetical protein
MAKIIQHTDEGGGDRYYEIDGIYVPSVTSILNRAPKKGLEAWFKAMGQQADVIRDQAAEEGSNVHYAIDDMLEGKRLSSSSYNRTEQACIMRFIDFWETAKPTLIKKEFVVYDKGNKKRSGFAGTVDLKCYIDGEKWTIDYKTSTGVYDTHFRQLAAYNFCDPEPSDRLGILHLKAKTRTKRGWMQGKGWKIDELVGEMDYLDMFFNCLKEYEHEVPKSKRKPRIYTIPDVFFVNLT